ELFDHAQLFGLFKGSYEPTQQLTRMWRSFYIKDAPKRVRFFSNLPSYIPSRNFALALLHTVSGDGVLSLESVKANALALPDSRVKQALLTAIGEAGNDLSRARASLEAWFDSSMDRVSGWYKRESQWILMAIGLVLAVALNIDTLGVARDLTQNNLLRQAMV